MTTPWAFPPSSAQPLPTVGLGARTTASVADRKKARQQKKREAAREERRALLALQKERTRACLGNFVAAAQARAAQMTEAQWWRSMSSRANVQNARARKYGSPGVLTGQELAEIRAASRDLCAQCGVDTRGAFHFDHRLSLSAGGHNVAANMQLLCIPCNLKKSNKDARITSLGQTL